MYVLPIFAAPTKSRGAANDSSSHPKTYYIDRTHNLNFDLQCLRKIYPLINF
ncbi:MAG: hypothetical protein AVDCRST_MAG95-2325 [uncultured Adhaeribacter sp.]|uniref:Uncharacterized protein n=1 Tax=uncultured Adhaeribacter sp. TaxID=448109 RepID=A0A6J4IT87_9BACT|nr:MAG: hypothetical protein AVDCRST_MAG95-2325 [uncultured Adhaeribacter sp.]